MAELKLLDDKLENELNNGLRLYQLERNFCLGGKTEQEDIDLVVHCRSYDVRILASISCQLSNQYYYDEEILEALQIAAKIFEIYDDLEDYHKDINHNTINIYRMFVRLHGLSSPQKLRDYVEVLNTELQYRLKLIEKTRQNMAKKFIESWNTYLEKYPIPEVPEPILEN